MAAEQLSLSELARAGFTELSTARGSLHDLGGLIDFDASLAPELFRLAADPDGALAWVLRLSERDPQRLRRLFDEPQAAARLIRLVGASEGIAEFLLRHPAECDALYLPAREVAQLPTRDELDEALLASVASRSGTARLGGEEGWCALRVAYRRQLVTICLADLEQADPVAGLDAVAACLADLAGAALDASLAVARADLSGAGPGCFPAQDVAATRLSVVGMGKAGARELNYVSDVDVIFVCAAAPQSAIEPARVVDVATRLAQLTMRGLDDLAVEPALWDVDANLRPEGKDGALVRSLDSHLAYYRRWAKNWEFQALLKARPLAGDLLLGAEYVAGVTPLVWESAGRDGFVGQVQAMRQRVTDNVPDDERDRQLKLGMGGLRDIEFTVQLLQLVHAQTDEGIRQRGTVAALTALAAAGYIGRAEATEFIGDYRTLRLLEHRVQLRTMTRTHLMPQDDDGLRLLARATGLATSGAELLRRWSRVKQRVRGLHERLFYRPLLAAVASTPNEEFNLTSEQAAARLAAIGFRDPAGALTHIRALTNGVSRSATIQQHLLPVLLQWFADGADPDHGLVTFRRLSEHLGGTHWFLRMLRDSSAAAKRLTLVLSGSRFVTELLARIPVAVAWLENDADLRPRPRSLLDDEAAAILHRHTSPDAAAAALRTVRRREVLRLALASILGTISAADLAAGLTDITEIVISGALDAALRSTPDADRVAVAVIAMGRFGGREPGFGSDADVLYVFRSRSPESEGAAKVAGAVIAELIRLCADPVLPIELDADLRPEGRNGQLVRSLAAYQAYYRRWSLTWEAQALLRARACAGDHELQRDFMAVADEVRYPREIDERSVREVKRIKARVEGERLPRGADPRRHLKLGRGSLSDVEWLVQVQQLRFASRIPALRTPSTMAALAACLDNEIIEPDDARILREAWVLSSRARSALTLWTNKTTDVLPADRVQLEAVARLLEYGPGAASEFEEDYLAVTRRARDVFERLFYGETELRPEYG